MYISDVNPSVNRWQKHFLLGNCERRTNSIEVWRELESKRLSIIPRIRRSYSSWKMSWSCWKTEKGREGSRSDYIWWHDRDNEWQSLWKAKDTWSSKDDAEGAGWKVSRRLHWSCTEIQGRDCEIHGVSECHVRQSNNRTASELRRQWRTARQSWCIRNSRRGWLSHREDWRRFFHCRRPSAVSIVSWNL